MPSSTVRPALPNQFAQLVSVIHFTLTREMPVVSAQMQIQGASIVRPLEILLASLVQLHFFLILGLPFVSVVKHISPTA